MNNHLNSSARPPLSVEGVAAVMVLFHPDLSLLGEVLAAIAGQVGHLILVDNTPGHNEARVNQEYIQARLGSITYLPLGDNFGIARGQNVGMNQATSAGFEHVLLLDQDSIVPNGMVAELLRVEQSMLESAIQVGALGPWFQDKKSGVIANAITHGRFFVTRNPFPLDSDSPVRADYLIASGSLIRTRVLAEVGLKQEDLFIDWVDVEWCLRASTFGYSHYLTPTIMMQHDIGDRVIKLFGRTICLHNDVRNYYIIRNACHLLMSPIIYRRWRINILLKIPLWVILFSVTSKTKFRALLLMLRACFDGLTRRMGRL